MCQYRFTECNKCITPVWDADSGGDCAYVGTSGNGNSVFPLNFVVNLKTVLKKSLKFI